MCKSNKSKAQGKKQETKQTGTTESECCATSHEEEPSGFEESQLIGFVVTVVLGGTT